ncbi:MAG: hypothetical protein O7E52_05435, partial [Candidatus Poribacteria bacterium]|nr:hypothetical protein [Candidatus Poribacteria bacterium]
MKRKWFITLLGWFSIALGILYLLPVAFIIYDAVYWCDYVSLSSILPWLGTVGIILGFLLLRRYSHYAKTQRLTLLISSILLILLSLVSIFFFSYQSSSLTSISGKTKTSLPTSS